MAGDYPRVGAVVVAIEGFRPEMIFVHRAEGSALYVVEVLRMVGEKFRNVVIPNLFCWVLSQPDEIEDADFFIVGRGPASIVRSVAITTTDVLFI